MYVAFSHAYPLHNNLWNRLIAEEKQHAEAIRKLYGLTYQGKVLFDEGTIQHAAVQSIIDYIKSISDSARNKKYSDKQIVSLSLDIEKSLLEKKLFDHFKVSSEFADVLKTLQEGSEAHASLVEKEMKNIG
jgi:hypothetical protein